MLDSLAEKWILRVAHVVVPQSRARKGRRADMPRSVLEAIKMGFWDFEPPDVGPAGFEPSDAMPGTREKLEALIERARAGLPLWHASDREDMEALSFPRKPR
jgi:hypothetical protein